MTTTLKSVGSALLERRGLAGLGVGVGLDLVLVILAALAVAHIVWVSLSPPAFVSTTGAGSLGAQSNASAGLRPDRSVFERFNPFNRDLETVVIADVVEDAPETTLNLEIRTLLTDVEIPQNSVVRIELPNGENQRFKVGDTVVNGVTIERILSDRVILLRRGEREVLFASETKVLETVTPDGDPVQRQSPRTAMIAGVEPPAPSAEISAEALNIRSAEDFLNRVLVRRVPTADGQTALTIFQGSDTDLLDVAGLAVGDQLVDVNGMSLEDRSIADLYEDLKDEDVLDFRIRRGETVFGRTIEIGN